MVGRSSAPSGVHTLRLRQSGSDSGVSRNEVVTPPSVWGHEGPGSVASRAFAHGSLGWGGRQAFSPVGGSAKGMLRKWRIPSTALSPPWTGPSVVATRSGSEGCVVGACANDQSGDAADWSFAHAPTTSASDQSGDAAD